jgi:hypothetical protein
MFGHDFKGDAEADASEVEVEVADESAEASPAETEETTEAIEAEEAPISSVTELLAHYELDPEWFESLKVPGKVDGKPVEYTLKDLRDKAQMFQAAEHRLEEAKTKAKAIVQEATAKNEATQAQFATAAKLIESAESMLDQDTKAVDWQKLREEDPAEYSARKAEVAERRERIEQMKHEASSAYQEAVKQNLAEFEKNRLQHLQEQHTLLLDKLPEWQDADKAKAGKAKLADYLMKQGFSDQDVAGASDHRLILMARKAMLYDELQANTDAAKKKVAKVPKVLKPGALKPKDQISRERVVQARSRLRQTGKLDDAYALLKARRGH